MHLTLIAGDLQCIRNQATGPTSITWHWTWKYPGSLQHQQTGPGLTPAPAALKSPICKGKEAETEGTDIRGVGGGIESRGTGFGGVGPHFIGVGAGDQWEEGEG